MLVKVGGAMEVLAGRRQGERSSLPSTPRRTREQVSSTGETVTTGGRDLNNNACIYIHVPQHVCRLSIAMQLYPIVDSP